jgi:hypothetical protein
MAVAAISQKRKNSLLSQSKLTETDLIRRHAAGLNLKDIRRISGLSESSLTRLLRSHNPSYVADHRRWHSRRRQAFVAYIRHRSLRKTAAEVGVRRQTLSGWFRAMHPEYVRIASKGALASVTSFLNRERNRSAIAEVEAWLLDQLPRLLLIEGDAPDDSFGDDVERSMTKRYTSRYADYRETLGERH